MGCLDNSPSQYEIGSCVLSHYSASEESEEPIEESDPLNYYCYAYYT